MVDLKTPHELEMGADDFPSLLVGGVSVVTCLHWLKTISDRQVKWSSLILLEDDTHRRII